MIFSLTPADREALFQLSADTGVSASALVRACISRAFPAIARQYRSARGDKEALKRYADRVTRDSLKQWGEE